MFINVYATKQQSIDISVPCVDQRKPTYIVRPVQYVQPIDYFPT